jgi:hypothetical protein
MWYLYVGGTAILAIILAKMLAPAAIKDRL